MSGGRPDAREHGLRVVAAHGTLTDRLMRLNLVDGAVRAKGNTKAIP